MRDGLARPVSVAGSGWNVTVAQEPPVILSDYIEHAEFWEDFRDGEDDGFLFVAVERPAEEWPSLVVTQSSSPAEGGFTPGVLVVPATQRVFIGAGTRLLCYRADPGSWIREWQAEVSVGFWRWRQHGDVVVMSAETDMAAWTVLGERLWTTLVEPPWSYTVAGGMIRLDVVGNVSAFPLVTGPASR
jgi:hypothetical protein